MHRNTSKLFSISNLRCSYNGEKEVLLIDKVDIPRGKVIAILGVSGSGKSTILETLGLMNNTMMSGSKILFHAGNGSTYDYHAVWESSKPTILEEIRNRHFSFIFQETNLMQNFTAYENACLSQMIQGTSYSKAIGKTLERLKEIGLSEVDKVKKVNELSGGQRQRIAFVRAITPEYTILFGDEPTGNLDEKTSEELLGVIKKDVINRDVSAVIVTHNITLAVHFADMIMVITKNNGIGVLNDQHIFYSENEEGKLVWQDSSSNQIENIEEKIKALL